MGVVNKAKTELRTELLCALILARYAKDTKAIQIASFNARSLLEKRTGLQISTDDLLNYFGATNYPDITDSAIDQFLDFIATTPPQHEVKTVCICASSGAA